MPHPDPTAPGMPGIKEPTPPGLAPPDPRGGSEGGGPYTREVVNGIQYTYDRDGNLVDVRAVPGAGAGGGGGGAAGPTQAEMDLAYNRLAQDQQQWEAEFDAAQANNDLNRMERAQNRLDDLAQQRAELDYRYAALGQGQRQWEAEFGQRSEQLGQGQRQWEAEFGYREEQDAARLGYDYARLEQDQKQWEAELLAAQASGDADRAQRAQEHLDNLGMRQAELTFRYQDAIAQRAWQGQENEFDRQFTAARDQARFSFEAGEAEKGRALDVFLQQDQQAFVAGESASDRELRLFMQANELGFSREELDLEKERFQATNELNQARFQFEVSESEKDRAERQQQREYQSAEAELDRTLTRYLQDDRQAWQSGENAADRSTRLALQGAELGFSREELAWEKQRFAQEHALNQQRFGLEKQRVGLEAAQQFANVIGSTDPGAYEAFSYAGGGNISNALAGGGTALSERAMLPAAMTLRTAREMGAPVGVGLAEQGITTETAPIAQEGEMAKPIIKAQRGFRGVVNQPTMFVAGEGGEPETVQVQNLRTGETGTPAYTRTAGTDRLPPGYAARFDAEAQARRRQEAAARLRALMEQANQSVDGEAGFAMPGYNALPKISPPSDLFMPGAPPTPPPPPAGPLYTREMPGGLQVQAWAEGANTQPQPVMRTQPIGEMPAAPPGAGTVQTNPPMATGSPYERRIGTNRLPPGYEARYGAEGMARRQQAIERLRARMRQGLYGGTWPQVSPGGVGLAGWPENLPPQMGGWQRGSLAEMPQSPYQWSPAGAPEMGQLNLPDIPYEGRPIWAQRGYQGVVNQPTPVIAGEGGQPESVSIQPLLGQYKPEMGEVKRLREGVQFGNINPFDVKSRLIDPVLWERFLRGRQTKYGIPVRSQVHEINRYQLAGARRGTRQGY